MTAAAKKKPAGATGSERVRASTLRRLEREGRELAAKDRAWLDAYEAADPRRQRVRRSRPLEEPAPAPAREPDPFRVLDFGSPELVQTGNDDDDDDDDDDDQDDAKQHRQACGIPDCPRCAAVAGALVCTTTGERVYPRMSEDGAAGVAGAILGLVAFVARILGRDCQPMKHEVAALGSALREVIYKRAGWAGSADDIFALLFVLGGYAVRVWHAPAVKPPETSPALTSPS